MYNACVYEQNKQSMFEQYHLGIKQSITINILCQKIGNEKRSFSTHKHKTYKTERTI